MKPHRLPEGQEIPFTVSQLVGTEVAAIALVCAVGHGAHASVAAYITPAAGVSTRFRHAVEMEGTYSDTLLSFDDNEPPFYGGLASPLDLHRAADELGVDRVLCLVTLDAHGDINVSRDYDGLEVTLLEAANLQFSRFAEILEQSPMPISHRVQ